MKYQQVTVDFTSMVFTACSYLALAGAVWILLRLIQACFWLPRHLKKQNNVQSMLQEKVEGYEKYILECEEKEKAELAEQESQGENVVPKDPEIAQKWKERRECLEMLKRELRKVREGDNSYDWDNLLEDYVDETHGASISEIEDEENLKGYRDDRTIRDVELDGIEYTENEKKKIK